MVLCEERAAACGNKIQVALNERGMKRRLSDVVLYPSPCLDIYSLASDP